MNYVIGSCVSAPGVFQKNKFLKSLNRELVQRSKRPEPEKILFDPKQDNQFKTEDF